MDSQDLSLTLVSDLHGWLPKLPGGDLLVIAGDFCPIRDHGIERQKNWVDGPFREWLYAQPYKNIVGVAGNHDFVAENPEGKKILESLPWEYLEDRAVWINGLCIWGSPWCSPCGRWAFMAPEFELEKRWAEMPSQCDLVVTHSPAHGWGDRVVSGDRVGSESLHGRLLEVAPALHVHGHIHEARSQSRITDKVPSINASLLDERYQSWGWCWTVRLQQTEAGWLAYHINEESIPGEAFIP